MYIYICILYKIYTQYNAYIDLQTYIYIFIIDKHNDNKNNVYIYRYTYIVAVCGSKHLSMSKIAKAGLDFMLRRPVSFSIPINPCRHLALCPAVAKPPAIASFTFCLKRDSECIHNIIQQVCVPFYHNSGPIPKYVSFCCGCASVAIVTFSPASHSYAWHLVLDVCETEKP